MKWWSKLRVRPAAEGTSPNPSAAALAIQLRELDDLFDANDLDAAQARLAALADTGPGPLHADLRLRQARLTRRRGDAAHAYASCEALLTEDCDAASVQLELADCAMAQHDLAKALEHVEIAVSVDDHHAMSWLRLGQILLRLDRHAEAEAALERASELLGTSSRSAEAWYALGEVRRVLRRPGATQAYQHCLAAQPSHAEAPIGLAHAFLLDEDEDQALHWYQRAIDQGASVPAAVRLNIGTIHQHAGRYAEARRQFEAVLAERPSDHLARFYLCMLDLLLERWVEGWQNFPTRFAAGALPYRPMPYAPWDGKPLGDEPLLVLADEGLGDEIMYASCLADLSTRANCCIVECEPRLVSLFRRSFPTLHIVATQRENSTTWLEGLPTPRWQICAGDVPAWCRRTADDFPRHQGYLHADPTRVAAWRQRLASLSSGQPVVGISWRGGTVMTRTKARSIAVDDWAPILALQNVTFVNLQYGAYREDLTALQKAHGVVIHDFPEIQSDYDETAALVSALNGVVSVCTAIVHLAGALGQRAWVLAPHTPGWRYTAHATTMPWYPSVHLFRQRTAGDWRQPCQEVSAALLALTKIGTNPAHDV